MPIFFFHFSDGRTLFPDDVGITSSNLEHAYLDICAPIPEMARELLIKRKDPLAAAYTIFDAREAGFDDCAVYGRSATVGMGFGNSAAATARMATVIKSPR